MGGVNVTWGICSNCKHRAGCFTFYDYRDISRPGWNCAMSDVNESPLTIIDSKILTNRVSGNDSNFLWKTKKCKSLYHLDGRCCR